MKSKEAAVCSYTKCEMGTVIEPGQDFMTDNSGETGGRFHLFCFDKFVDSGKAAKFLVKKKAAPPAQDSSGKVAAKDSPLQILIPLQLISENARKLADAYLKNPTFREIEPASMRDVVGRFDTDEWAKKVADTLDDWKIVFGQK